MESWNNYLKTISQNAGGRYQRLWWPIGAMFILSFSPAGAQNTPEQCANISDNLARLQCYDNYFKSEQAEPTPVPPPSEPRDVAQDTAGAWELTTSTNPIDDSETIVISLMAEEGTGTFGNPILLIARCQANTTEVFVNWGRYLGNDGSFRQSFKRVAVRLGDAPATNERWNLSTSSRATFTPNWGGAFLKQLTMNSRLVLQTTPTGSGPVTAVFDTSGLASAITPLTDACDWSLD